MPTFDRKMTAWEKKIRRIADPIERAANLAAFDLRKEVSKNFDRARDPNGKRWKKRTKRYPWPILRKTNKLRRSWSVKVFGRSDIKFASSDPKHVFHQLGTRNMPARPQAPVSKLPAAYSRIIEFRVIDELAEHFGGAARG